MSSFSGASCCQLCLRKESIVIDSQTLNESFEDMFAVFKLPVNYTAPTRLCEECCKQLHASYKFHQQILVSISRTEVPPSQTAPAQEEPQNPLYSCDSCNLHYDSNLLLQRHRKLVHVASGTFPKHYYCDHCHKTFKTPRGKEQHLNYCHNPNAQQFRCEQCCRDFSTKTSYLNHQKIHQDFLCRFCDHGWISENQLLQHVTTAHKDRLFRCKHCAKTEALRKTLNRHLRTAHDLYEAEYYCGHCSIDVPFQTMVALYEHLHETHKNAEAVGGVYSDFLNEPFFTKDIGLEVDPANEATKHEESKENFLKHFNLMRINEIPRLSDNCTGNVLNPNKMILEEFLDEAFENDQIWTKYIEGGEEYLIDNYDFYLDGPSTKSTFGYKCPQCEQGFNKQLLLTVHLAEMHNVSCLVCNDCGANFNRIKEYKNHRQEHLKDNTRFIENIIPEAEEALALVKEEVKQYTVNEVNGNYVYTCKLCERTFAKKCNLEKHQCLFYAHHSSSETPPKPTQLATDSSLPENLFCTLCDKKFTSISGLKYHLKRHTGTKAFSCMYCAKKFTASSNLNAHIRNVHSASKNHPCPECDQMFSCKDHLTKHIRSKHRQDRPFACSECPKRYFQKSHLNDHVAAAHMNYRAFVCELCSTPYSCKGSLRRHVAKSHKNA